MNLIYSKQKKEKLSNWGTMLKFKVNRQGHKQHLFRYKPYQKNSMQQN